MIREESLGCRLPVPRPGLWHAWIRSAITPIEAELCYALRALVVLAEFSISTLPFALPARREITLSLPSAI